MAKVVFPVPEEPATTTELWGRKPPSMMASRPWIPVRTRSGSGKRNLLASTLATFRSVRPVIGFGGPRSDLVSECLHKLSDLVEHYLHMAAARDRADVKHLSVELVGEDRKLPGKVFTAE